MKHSFCSLTAGAFMAAVAVMATGCSSEENASSTYVAEGTPITVNAIVGEMETKAGYGAENTPKQFYLKIDNLNKDKYSYYALMKKSGSAWESFDGKDSSNPALAMYWAGDNADVEVTACTYDFNTFLAPNVQTDQTASLDSSDELIMETDKNVKPSTDGIKVTLKHMMSKLIVTIDLGKDVEYTKNPVSDFVVGGTQTQRDFSFDTFTFSGSIDGSVKDIQAYTDDNMFTPSTKTGEEITTAAVAKYEAILIPQTVSASSFKVSFKLSDGKTYNWTPSSDVELESNTQYTLSLKMNGDKLTLGTISLDKWGDATDLGTGTVEEAVAENIPVLEIDENDLRVTEDRISSALNGGKKLKITGKITAADVTTLAKDKNIEVLDLSEATAATGYNINKISFFSGESGNTTLKEVTMPKSMTTIPEACFAMCTNLETITLPTSLTTIETSAFQYAGITEITIPSGVTKIEQLTFGNCSKLKKVTLQGNVTSIAKEAFTDCSSLEGITIPSTVTSIGRNAFANCHSLAKVTFSAPSELTTLDSKVFKDCILLEEITLPSKLTSIPASAFDNCVKLKTVTCEGDITEIGATAFAFGGDFGKGVLADIYLKNNTALPALGSSSIVSNNSKVVNVHLSTDLFGKRTSDTNYSSWDLNTFTFVEN